MKMNSPATPDGMENSAIQDGQETTAGEQAEALKIKGNEALGQGKYAQAIELYTQAIDLDDRKPVFFANRAQAHIKTEAYGLAIADASRALALDPKYTKALYRRAVAHTAIVQHQQALLDFRAVFEQAPSDVLAQLRLSECQKVIRRIAFEKAIEQPDAPSIFETVDIACVAVPADYDGQALELDSNGNAVMSLAYIDDMVMRFKAGKTIARKYAMEIVKTAAGVLKAELTLNEIDVHGTLTVCGDTHGQFYDLLEIFRKNGVPSETHSYLFNGDFVDRGSWSTEVALLLYAYKILYPSHFFINRGNHETDDMNKVYGFEGECKAKYVSDNVFKMFSESFSYLPLATLVSRKYLVLHGGLFSDDKVSLDDIRSLNRLSRKQPGQQGIMLEMLWTDPQPEDGRGPSKRGVGIQFGPDVTRRFCEANRLKAVIRSHEVRANGYEEEHGGRLITVFSAPNYCDFQGNKGAYINIDESLNLDFQVFEAVPHPPIQPMAYASKLMA